MNYIVIVQCEHYAAKYGTDRRGDYTQAPSFENRLPLSSPIH